MLRRAIRLEKAIDMILANPDYKEELGKYQLTAGDWKKIKLLARILEVHSSA